MLKNNIKFAWRNLVKDRQFTFLNLLGLSTGLACTLLIYLWVNDEWHVDKFNKNDSQLYQVLKNDGNADGTVVTRETTQGLLAKTMAAQLPEVKYAVSVTSQDEPGVLTTGEKHIKAKPVYVDKDFFNVFSYRLLEGDQNQIAADKKGIWLSDKLAEKLFGSTANITGKTIAWDHGDEFSGLYTVAGVYQSAPGNASHQYELLFSYGLYAQKKAGGMGDISYWGSNMSQTYLLLKDGTDINRFNEKIKDFTKTTIKLLYANSDIAKYEGQLFAQRYSERYLNNHYENGLPSGGRIEYVKLFSVIAGFILIIACINFMNLSTAKASRRLKEIGVRKVVGASRTSLVFQHLSESLLMGFLSLVIAVFLMIILLPGFNQITGKQLNIYFDTNVILSAIAITFITGLIAGSYPALYLSGFNPVSVLKGKLKASVSEVLVRKGLVVFQFTLSAIFIVAVIVIYQQMDLIRTKNLGYSKDNIIHFPVEGNMRKELEPFLSEVKKVPGVVNASCMEGDMLGNAGHSGGGIGWEGKDPNLNIEYYGIGVNYDCIEMLGLKMREGRTFSGAFGSDSSKVIFNEAAIAAMGLKDPINKTVSLWGHPNQIIGVVKDFHFASLYNKVGPMFLYYSPGNSEDGGSVLIKIKTGKAAETLSGLEKIYKTYNQGVPFEYKFLDEEFQKLYASEQRVSALSKYFAALAIIISCLGLYGLATFTAQRRQKEIGIRKIVGASVGNVTLLLSVDFLKLVLIAVLIAFPAAWWAMNQWLNGFAYRVNFGVEIFMAAGLSIVLISLLTVSSQALKTALANPVKSLRSE